LDNLDARNQPNPDGYFDFIEGITIDTRKGRIFFPLVEPFGKDLRDRMTDFQTPEQDREKHLTADKYVFEELYDSTHTKAEQVAEKNKFVLKGHYRSSVSSDIYLNAMNVPRGSVQVTAGGVQLTEGVDYTVDYTLGRVKILNSGLLESGTPIKINLESNSLFRLQTKTLMGTHLNYKFSENFNLGATYMRLTERPLTSKVSMGEEPISNSIYGLNASYRTESQALTTLIDKLPLIETKEPSSITVDGEFAYLRPGQSKIIENYAFIDDFEGAQTKLELKTYINWYHSSAPLDFLNTNDREGIRSGYKRGKLSWFTIDPTFYSKSPPSLPDGELNSHYTREVKMEELFPERDEDIPGFESNIYTLNVVYYPEERGIYNFNTDDLNSEGLLNNPEENWGGMMREIITSDFETSNIEYIEFWMMDPFVENENSNGGDLYFHLGEISEDILRDSRKSFENGYSTTAEIKDVEQTEWGFVPRGQALNTSFNTNEGARQFQDVGLDGLGNFGENNNPEYAFHDSVTQYVDYVQANVANVEAKEKILSDPAADNYEYFLSSNHNENLHGIIERYKNYNGLEGNSPESQSTIESSKSSPDVEDINEDNTLNTTETYYQYRVRLAPQEMRVGENFIVDKVIGNEANGKKVNWYQFRIPIDLYEKTYGEISDFRSIRFMRMVLSGFEEQVVCRFATLELVRGEWRRYKFDLNTAATSLTFQNNTAADFEVSAVNIEENSTKEPIPYTLPPEVTRQNDPSNPQFKELNEQSLLLKVFNLQDNDARAVFKNVDFDFRQYKKIEMYIHAEELENQLVDNYELSAFVRIGSDYQDNYYEYEIPLEITKVNELRAILDESNDDKAKRYIWPDNNNLQLELNELVEAKKERNRLINKDPINYSTQIIYPYSKNPKIKVKGNPTISDVRQIMIGVRNRGDDSGTENDGLPKSVEVWFNELRLTGFNNKGGWAANGRMQVKMADLGVLNLAGATSTPGFGGIEQKV
ncbi:MAG: cell surface protein SprA, partial [Bacteroidales bacterium]|nr:cell surface protein SprA [Bacteroidales bacterium]